MNLRLRHERSAASNHRISHWFWHFVQIELPSCPGRLPGSRAAARFLQPESPGPHSKGHSACQLLHNGLALAAAMEAVLLGDSGGGVGEGGDEG